MAKEYKTQNNDVRYADQVFTSSYYNPFGDVPAVTSRKLNPVTYSSVQTISNLSGKGKKAYAGTRCYHYVERNEPINLNHVLERVVWFQNPKPPYNEKKGLYRYTITGQIPALQGQFKQGLMKNFDELIRDTMNRMLQTGGFGKPPKSVGLGESLGELGLAAGRLTESLLKMSPPIPRPPGRWDLWTPDELAEFRSWKDVFHPLEILFGLYPVADQVTELALNAKDKAEGYAYKCEKWMRKLKKARSPFRATIREATLGGDEPFTPSDALTVQIVKQKSMLESWLTGRMTCSDYTAFSAPYDIITYYNESWAITAWDLVPYSYLFDRFTGSGVKNLLRAAIKASNSTSTGAFKKNEQLISIENVQVHVLKTTHTTSQSFFNKKGGNTGKTSNEVYTRTWPDEIGVISEVANTAANVASLFDRTIKPLNGWTPLQYMDVLFLFIPSVTLKR